MHLQKYTTKSEAAKAVANRIVSAINAFQPTESKPFVIGLPTGSSPEPVYAELVNLYKAGKVSFQNVVTFNMDEYCGLEPTNVQSYHYFMYKNLFDHIDIKPENIHILNGLAENPKEECAAYEREIAKRAPFNIFMGGLGPKGHIAFNEAGSSRDSITREVALEESTIEANSRFFGNDKSKVPRFALSVGISTVLDNSEELIILVFGSTKADILQKTISTPISSEIPSTFLQTHKNCTLVYDVEAAAKL